jgi:phage I-like protein
MRSTFSRKALALAACSALAALDASAQGELAMCTMEIKSVGAELQLTPAGEFRSIDGRPYECATWRIDQAIAELVVRRAGERTSRMVIDYEHQTLLAERNGQPAPAAAWFKALTWREGAGLFATDVEWTARAKAMVEAREYRYVSPVFRYDPVTGDVLEILHAALTNNPGLDGMREILAAASVRAALSLERNNVNELLKKLLAALGLPAATNEADALAGVAALKTKADQAAGLEGEVAALKSATPDPTKYVPIAAMTTLQTELATLRAKVGGDEVEAIVSKAIQDGKLIPAQEGWARDLGKKDLAALKSFVDTAQPIAALGGQQSQGKKFDADGKPKLSDEQLAVCKALGLKPEDYAAQLAAEAA